MEKDKDKEYKETKVDIKNKSTIDSTHNVLTICPLCRTDISIYISDIIDEKYPSIRCNSCLFLIRNNLSDKIGYLTNLIDKIQLGIYNIETSIRNNYY